MYQSPVPVFFTLGFLVPILMAMGYFAPFVPVAVPIVLIPAPLNYFKFVPPVPNSHFPFSFLSDS